MKQGIIDKYKQKIADKNEATKSFQILVDSFADQESYQEAANCQEHIKRTEWLNQRYELFISSLETDSAILEGDYFSGEYEMIIEHVEAIKVDLAIFLDLKDYANAHKYKARINILQEISRVLAEFIDDMGKLIDSKKQKET